MFNTGADTIAGPVDILIGGGAGPGHIISLDAKGDGLLDLAVATGGPEFVSVFLNNAIGDCDADFNGDGVVDTQDVLAFFNAWIVGDPSADINADGDVNTLDVLKFLNLWTAGC